MTVYKRDVISDTALDTHGYSCQASINSDGCLCIREQIKGIIGESREEQVTVFNAMETRSIFELISKIKALLPNDLPF